MLVLSLALVLRSAAFANMGMAAEPANSQAPLITMLKKKGKRIIENADEVMAHLKDAFPWARFNTLDGDAVASMSIKEQVLVLHAALSCKCQIVAGSASQRPVRQGWPTSMQLSACSAVLAEQDRPRCMASSMTLNTLCPPPL